MTPPARFPSRLAAFLFAIALLPGARAAEIEAVPAKWTPAGWGGGGYFYAAVYHPAKDGVIYMGGDVNGVFRSDDHGLHWKGVNNGLANYGVFSLAVDPTHPDTVYAATEAGLCKSLDMGEHWEILPQTRQKELHITGEKARSVRSIAVDPTNGNTVYAASPVGKVFKSTDGGQSWNTVYTVPTEKSAPGIVRVQFGRVDGNAFGGLWMPVKFPEGADPKACTGIGFHFQSGKNAALPRTCNVLLKTAAGIPYQSKGLMDLFSHSEAEDVVLAPADFVLDPEYAKKNADKIATLPPVPDLATVTRLDFACSGALDHEAYVGAISTFFFAFGTQPVVPFADLTEGKPIQSYGSFRAGDAKPNTIYSVAVSPKNPSLVLAATADVGLVLSQDAGATWTEVAGVPQRAYGATFDPVDENIAYGAFGGEGLWKSSDKGKTWAKITEATSKNYVFKEVAVSAANNQNVYAIAVANTWGGSFFSSADGGTTWSKVSTVTVDPVADPTLDRDSPTKTVMSSPSNLALNPLNPREIYLSINWRPAWSGDGGATWTERDAGADITCVADIRFSGKRTYTSAMDEGTLASDDQGVTWRQLWPLKNTDDLSGHDWRIGVSPLNGADHLIGTASPWNQAHQARVVVSDDGGKTFKVTTAGLPDYVVHANTMWGSGYGRALAIDPNDPKVVYMGIDGDATTGKSGGGIFKSLDAGMTWSQLPNQPPSRRMFYGLAVDPTDSKRLYWGACGAGGGLYRSDDGGATWKLVFSQATWIFNLHVTADGTLYALEKNVWRSTDHGNTWKQISNFAENWSGIGFDVDPRDPKTMWLSRTTWDNNSIGAVYKTSDGGETWQNITGDLPYVKPLVLRYNPATGDLWAGGVGLYRLHQSGEEATK